MTFSLYGLTSYDVQYWNNSTWVTVPGGSVTGNNKVWRKFTFSPITTSKIRVLTNASVDGYSRITEVEALGPMETSASSIKWLVADHLGTPRMIFDQSGSLATTKRHDYLPFGEEIFAPTGGRTAAMGYSGGDGMRQQFTSQERDVETGLDYFLARYYSSTQGRFTGVDPLQESAVPALPQSWNRYVYCLNNPLVFIDPTGELWIASGNAGNPYQWVDTCPEGGTCYETVAASVTADDDVTYAVVYGANGSDDINAYRPNEYGMIDLRVIATNPSAEFGVRREPTDERFANVETTVALYNATEYYSRLYPDDAEITVSAASLRDGTGSPIHPRSHGAPNSAIDFRYLDGNGQMLQGAAAAANADATRMTRLFDAFRASGFNQAVSGRPQAFGTGPMRRANETEQQRNARLRMIGQHQNHGHVGIVARLRGR